MKFKLEPVKITEQKLKKIETRVNLEPQEESPTKNAVLVSREWRKRRQVGEVPDERIVEALMESLARMNNNKSPMKL